MKKLFIILGIILGIILLTIIGRCIIFETKFKVIKTENDKTFFVVIEQKGISNRDYQISIYSAFKKTRFHSEGNVNKLDIKYDSAVNDFKFYEISITNDVGENKVYWQLYSKEFSKLLDKSMLVKNFDDYNYPKIKNYVLKKLSDGEVEWLYSYGGQLLSEGHYEILEEIKNITAVEQCENDFIEANLVYEKSREFLQKYGGGQ